MREPGQLSREHCKTRFQSRSTDPSSPVQEIHGIRSGAQKDFLGCCSGLLSPASEGLLLTGKPDDFCSIALSAGGNFDEGKQLKALATDRFLPGLQQVDG